MISYLERNVNTISLIISIIIFILIDILFLDADKIKFNFTFNSGQAQENIISNEGEEENSVTEDTKEETFNSIDSNWYIEIPSIDLKAEIAEDTTQEVMSKYVGHFTETSKTQGNIGLAAHNRGYEVNYFMHLKDLEYEAEIIYRCGDFKKTYLVDTMEIIKNTDWTYLEDTEYNTITLITCVENQPEYRRCIQGTEK